MNRKKLGLPTVVATGVGMIIATSCIFSLGQGASAIGTPFIIAMLIAVAINICTALSLSELNALMPDLTGGIAQFSHASFGAFITIITMVGGYIACNTIVGSAETAMFGNTIKSVLPGVPISGTAWTIIALIFLIVVNLNGLNVFAKIQDFVAYALIISMVIIGILGCIKINPAAVVTQPKVLDSSLKGVTGLCSTAFFLFIGCEFVIPIAGHVKNTRRNIPLGMIISLLVVFGMQSILIFGFSNTVPWSDLAGSTTPHILYGSLLLGKAGQIWMAIVSVLAVTSTINSQISSVSYIILGMSKIGLLPGFLGKTNKKGAPYVGVFIVAGIMIAVNAAGLSTSDQLSFLILTGCVFWMISYLFSDLACIVLRVRYPKRPRTFKLPLGPVIPLIGMAGTVYMILNIDPDPAVRKSIYIAVGLIAAALAVYAALWVKLVMKDKLFRPEPIEKIMEYEMGLYDSYKVRGTKIGEVEKEENWLIDEVKRKQKNLKDEI